MNWVALRRLKRGAQDYLRIAYCALFHSHTTGHSTGVRNVLIQQKIALRILTGSSHRSSCRPIFASMKVHTVVSHVLSSLEFAKQSESIGRWYTRTQYKGDWGCSHPNPNLNVKRDYHPVVGLVAYKLFNKLPRDIRILLPINRSKTKKVIKESSVFHRWVWPSWWEI